MVLIIILTFICVNFTQKYKVLLGESTFHFRLLLISLLYVDALTLNITLSIYSVTEAISIFGLFVITFRSLVCQAISINVSIFTIANLIINNKYKDPVRFVLGLCTKLLMKLVDITFLVPLSLFASTMFHDVYNIKMSVLSSKELEELNEDMRVTLKQLNQISFSLQKMKMENKDLDLLLDKKGNLDIEVSENTKLSQEELSKLAQKVMISDRCYNSQLDKYKELVDKDVKQNNGEFSSVFNKHLDSIDSKYKQLFISDQ